MSPQIKMRAPSISVTILVKNGERHLYDVLTSLTSFPEVIIYDTGSVDKTLEIARSFKNVMVHQGPFEGFGKTHNQASRLASFDWILSIDSDEILTQELIDEISELKLNPHFIYRIKRKNFFNDKEIKWCGWQSDQPIRLYNRKISSFSEAMVHEGVMERGKTVITLKHSLKHFPYDSIECFLKKMDHYSTLFAEQYCGKKRSSPFIAVMHGLWAFFKSYIIKKGFLGGYEGHLISLYNGHTSYYKYLKLYHLNAKKNRQIR